MMKWMFIVVLTTMMLLFSDVTANKLRKPSPEQPQPQQQHPQPQQHHPQQRRPLKRKYNTTSTIMPGKINVHVMSHSHDDVGWLKSPEQYAFGANDIGILPSLYYADGYVWLTLDTVVSALARNPDRKFTVVETFFFRKWFDNTDSDTQELVHTLVNNGQLKFVNSGIVMADEACPIYTDMLDQSTAGSKFISDTFGYDACARVTSQIDPFGHSAFAAQLSSPISGYYGMFMARMDYQERSVRGENKTLDFAWMPSSSLGQSIITLGAYGFQDGYSTPGGLCFDASIECYPFNNPMNDDGDLDSEDNNVLQYVQTLLSAASRYSQTYPFDDVSNQTMNLPMYFGDDFQWTNAFRNYASIDRLIHYVNLNTSIHNVNVLYSSQEDYALARIGSNTPLSLRTGDAFVYCDGAHSCWTGYYTSRPALKGYVRDSSGVFQMSKQVQVFSGASPSDAVGTGQENPLWLLETAMGVLQHHDAVSGTSKQSVAQDYAKRLAVGRAKADSFLSEWFNTMLGTSAAPVLFQSCDLSNATICSMTEAAAVQGNTIVLLLYNPQSHARAASSSSPIRIPVGIIPSLNINSWAVLGPDGATPIQAQLVPSSSADTSLRQTYYGMPSAGPTNGPTDGRMEWLVFYPPSLSGGVPAMGYTTVFLTPAKSVTDAPFTFISKVKMSSLTSNTHDDDNDGYQLSNGIITLQFDNTTGLLSSYASTQVRNGASIPISQSLFYYISNSGDAVSSQASGAYIFRIKENTTAMPVAGFNSSSSTPVNVTFISGPIVNEAHQVFGVASSATWATQVIRVYANSTHSFDVEWTVGPIPLNDLLGKEVISRFTLLNWSNNATWYSDSNGREMQERIRNYAPQYTRTVTEQVPQNYYPINAAVKMQDVNSNTAFVIITDRTQGGGSPVQDGVLELMVHRRLLADDGRGVMEALNEPGVNGEGLIVRGKHTVLFADQADVPLAHKQAQQNNAILPILWRCGILPASAPNPAIWAASLVTTFSGLSLTQPLPLNVELVTVHGWNSTSILVRLAHLFEVGEDPVYSQNVTVSLANLFNAATTVPGGRIQVKGATEMTLIGNQPLTNVQPITYNIASAASSSSSTSLETISITLPIVPPAPAGADLEVTLSPMQIRTFVLEVTLS